MTRWSGLVGFESETIETEPSVYEEVKIERKYKGDLINFRRRLTDSNVINPGVTVSVSISIVTDAYAKQNFFSIRYVEYMGKFWTVSEVQPEFPRLVLTLGGLYHAE